MNTNSRSGFTLLETLTAIAVVAILLTTFLAVFGPATSGIRQANSVEDADRLASALEKEIATLHEEERSRYETAFEKGFTWVSDSSSLKSAIILFNYRGDIAQVRDGNLQPYREEGGVAGKDYLIQPAAYRVDEGNNLKELLEAADGNAFVVRMRQLVRSQDGGLVASPAGSPIQNSDGSTASSSEQFTGTVIAVQADFFTLPAVSYEYVKGPMSRGGQESFEEVLGSVLFSRSMAVRR